MGSATQQGIRARPQSGAQSQGAAQLAPHRKSTSAKDPAKDKRAKAALSKSSNAGIQQTKPGLATGITGAPTSNRHPLSPKLDSEGHNHRNLLEDAAGYIDEEAKNAHSSEAGRHRPPQQGLKS